MKGGWFNNGGERYYLGADGAAATGFKTLSGRTYYLDPKDGHMLKNTYFTVDGRRYYANANGVVS